MSTLVFEKLKIKGVALGDESSLPSIAGMSNVQQITKTVLNEDEELFIGNGFVDTCYPYRVLDMYNRELEEIELDSAILENEYLKAVFIPTLGGRLWSLFDKKENRELTFSNPVFRVGNLSVRNAWFSGGVEWNCGLVGHHPYTCSSLFTATLSTDDGTPVLRMYEFERIRNATYQMDFFLPEGSKTLFCRMRIVNPNTFTIPMYWWSNIAVPELKKGRVIVPADEAYSNQGAIIHRVPVPIHREIDITYPTNNQFALDYFWKIDKNNRKYICHLDENGYGLAQTSTSRLKGRKLFVWGQGPGGDRWQEFLSEDGTGGRYVEIQAGLARTQYECIPMPPKTAWEWVEAYGAMQADKAKVHGDWDHAKREVESRLSEIICEEKLQKILEDTRKTIALKPADKIIYSGSGWGALENLRREKKGEEKISGHLDFGNTKSEQEPWVFLLENGFLKEENEKDIPKSWINQSSWGTMLEKAVSEADQYNWNAWLHLGIYFMSEKRFNEAKKALERSMEQKPSCWALYALANIEKLKGDDKKAGMLAMKASIMKAEDVSLAKEAMKLLFSGGLYSNLLEFAERLPEHIKANGRVKFYKAYAYLRTGKLKEAGELIYGEGGMVIPDIREGENCITELWLEYEEAKAAEDGRKIEKDDITPPANLDFRMQAVRKEVLGKN